MGNELWQISPVDGRYSNKTIELQQFASEAALIRYRVQVEVEWIIALIEEEKLTELRPLDPDLIKRLRNLYLKFSSETAEKVKAIESKTNHDVKAVEYFLKEECASFLPTEYLEYFHFACTSEDINSTAYALMIKDLNNHLTEYLGNFQNDLKNKIHLWKDVPLLSKTHGQPASPSTVGKELLVFYARIEKQFRLLKEVPLYAKMSGAVGSYNAHISAYPDIDWPQLSKNVLEKQMGLKINSVTTQIEPHDFMAEIFDTFSRICSILIDFSRDIWLYISYEYIKQSAVKGEVGSSTMPHKVNPIDFENAEGNLLLSRNLFRFFADKLTISRLQRDLTDSTTLRNIGTAYAHMLVSLKSFAKGMNKIDLNREKILNDLDDHWEVLSEPIQTVMKKYGIENPYEQLKQFTRGNVIDRESLKVLIKNLAISDKDKSVLLDLTPMNYIGNSIDLIDEYFSELKNLSD